MLRGKVNFAGMVSPERAWRLPRVRVFRWCMASLTSVVPWRRVNGTSRAAGAEGHARVRREPVEVSSGDDLGKSGDDVVTRYRCAPAGARAGGRCGVGALGQLACPLRRELVTLGVSSRS